MSYIDIRYANFLPPSLTVGEARDLGPKYITAEDLALVRDKLAERVSQIRRVHVPVKEPKAPVQVTEPTIAKSVHSSRAEFDFGEEEMVMRRALTIDHFVPGAWSVARQQEPQGRDPTPPPPPPSCSWKRQHTTEQLTVGLGDAPSRTPPRAFGGITIRETRGDAQPTT